MKTKILAFILLSFAFTAGFVSAQESPAKIILLISEQNIESPQSAWWVSEVDLSATEARIASRLIEQGFEVIEPAQLGEEIKQDKAFRRLELSAQDSVKLGNRGNADYVILGKAVASAGGTVPSSKMRSCHANITVKVIRVKDSKVVGYLDASGSSAHMDVITGGKEALVAGAGLIADQIILLIQDKGKAVSATQEKAQ
jgi:hypothetical protein